MALAAWPAGPEFPRFLQDLMAAELSRLRPGAVFPPSIWRGGDLGTDSLEQLNLAISVSTALQFAQAKKPDRLQEMRSFDQWIAEARSVLEGGCDAVGFKTSGSTGEPRFVAQPLAALAQEIGFLAEQFSTVERVVALVPSHHIYGFLFTVLLPQALNRPVVDARVHAPASLPALLRPKDLIVGFPTGWQAAALAAGAWPADVQGVSSGAPCPSETARTVRARGLKRLVEIYGSTETGGIGWRDLADEPFRLFPYWARIDDDKVMKETDGSPQVFELPDIVSWHGLDRLAPLRRRDGAVQIAGVNVFPDFVRAVLAAHPDVAEAAVRPMKPNEGDRLKAFVVPKHPDAEIENLRRSLESWLAQRLTAAQLPRAFNFGAATPRDARGKPADWAI